MIDQNKAAKKIAEIIRRLSDASTLAISAKEKAEKGNYQEALELLYGMGLEMCEIEHNLTMARLYLK